MRMGDEKRPTCSCGKKMKYIEFDGEYTAFWFWDCDECDLQDEMEKYDPDEIRGD